MIYAPLDMQQTMGRESEQRVLSVSSLLYIFNWILPSTSMVKQWSQKLIFNSTMLKKEHMI